MPPKYGRGSYRRSGYTRTPYAKKRYSARMGPYSTRRKSYRLAASGNRKYTGAKPVYGLKSTVPTTVVPNTRQRVEVKQHSHLDSIAEYGYEGSISAYVISDDDDVEQVLELAVERVGKPLPALEELYGPFPNAPAPQIRPIRPEAFATEFTRIHRHLTHLAEGFQHNHRVGRAVNVTGVQIMASTASVIARDKVINSDAVGRADITAPPRRPTEWHFILLQEYQVPTNDVIMPLQQMLTTMYDAECCNNVAQLLIAPKNRYTADAHGKILMHKKIIVDEKRPVTTRKYSLRFPKPIVVKYKGVQAENVAENRLVLYVFPVVMGDEDSFTVTGTYEEGAPAVTKYFGRICFEASWMNYNTVLYYTDP